MEELAGAPDEEQQRSLRRLVVRAKLGSNGTAQATQIPLNANRDAQTAQVADCA